jgi:hypothetical protein
MPPPYLDPTKPLPSPDQLPRGLITPPPEVLEVNAREKARLAPYYTPEYEILALNELTLAYYFEHQLVAYRPTPQGPLVLAVGGEEVGELFKNGPPEQLEDVEVMQP